VRAENWRWVARANAPWCFFLQIGKCRSRILADENPLVQIGQIALPARPLGEELRLLCRDGLRR
jgi:hypothetical protein